MMYNNTTKKKKNIIILWNFICSQGVRLHHESHFFRFVAVVRFCDKTFCGRVIKIEYIRTRFVVHMNVCKVNVETQEAKGNRSLKLFFNSISNRQIRFNLNGNRWTPNEFSQILIPMKMRNAIVNPMYEDTNDGGTGRKHTK